MSITIFVKVEDETYPASVSTDTTPRDLRTQLIDEGVSAEGMVFHFMGEEVPEGKPVIGCGVSADGEITTSFECTDDCVEYGSNVAIFCNDGSCRMDVGGYAVLKDCRTADNTPTSRFIITRPEGVRGGSQLRVDHPFSMVTEDGKISMCIKPPCYKTNIPPTHESWATVLRFVPCSNSSKFVRFGDIVRIITVEGSVCCDVGPDTVRQIPSDATDKQGDVMKVVRR